MSADRSRPLAVTHAVDHPVYAVAGGNHVSLLLHRDDAGCLLDVIEVLAQPGGGPPPHRHAFAEWFHVLEGQLTLSEERDGTVRCTRTLTAGDSVFVAPWTVHGTLNLSDAPARFRVVSQPGAMTGYFLEAGVLVPDEHTPPDHQPAGPAQLREIAASWGIEFWSGPVENPPVRPGSSRRAARGSSHTHIPRPRRGPASGRCCAGPRARPHWRPQIQVEGVAAGAHHRSSPNSSSH